MLGCNRKGSSVRLFANLAWPDLLCLDFSASLHNSVDLLGELPPTPSGRSGSLSVFFLLLLILHDGEIAPSMLQGDWPPTRRLTVVP